MVKGFDSTQSDPSKIFLDYILSFFDKNSLHISPKKADLLIKEWIKNSSSTSWVYSRFASMQVKPKIIINKKCPQTLFSSAPSEGDSNYPAYPKQQQIHICLNNIRNKIELKQNLDRQLYTMLQLNKKNASNEKSGKEQKYVYKDKILMQSLYEGCQKGYQNYGWQQQTKKRVSRKCAVYLFRRRTDSNLPPDSIFRYSFKLAQQLCL